MVDSVLTFNYAIGSPQELAEGDYKDLNSSVRLEEIKRHLVNRRRVIVPKFIGVYQSEEIIAHGFDRVNEEEVRKINEAVSVMDRFNESLINMASRIKGEPRDNLQSGLIHVLYDSKIWNEEMTRMAINDNLGRIGYSSLVNLPIFYEKNFDFISDEIVKRIDNLKEKTNLKGDRELTSMIGQVVEMKIKYGLTRTEFTLLRMANEYAFGKTKLILGDELRALAKELHETGEIERTLSERR